MVITITLSQGDATKFTINFGDTTLDVTFDPTYPPGTSSFTVPHTYANRGYYTPDLSWQHIFNPTWSGAMTFQETLIVEEAPNGFVLTSSSNQISQGDTVTFTVWVTQGSHLTYRLSYGDGAFGIKAANWNSNDPGSEVTLPAHLQTSGKVQTKGCCI